MLNLLNELHGVLKAVLFLQLLDLGLAVLNEGLGIRAFIIVISLFLSFSINQLFIQKRSALPRDLRKNGYSPNTRRAFAAVVRNTSSGASALRWAMYAPT